MDNQEKQRDVQQEEKALKLFGLLQNTPEDLLERSEKKRPGVIAFIQKHNTTLVACIALLLIGVGFLCYRGVGGSDNASSSEMVYDVGSSSNSIVSSDGAQNEAVADKENVPEEEPEYHYIADNKDIADMFQEALSGTAEEPTETETDGATGAAPEAGEAAPEGLAGKLSVIDIPEGYAYENITSSLNDGKEVLVLRLQHSDGRYMELQIRGGDAETKEEEVTEPRMTIVDLGGNLIEQTGEEISLPVDENGATYLNVRYASGMSVYYNGTADAREVYQILESLE